jgi:leader peptidase (prepilin peptidase) / N-methyltransferase
MVVAAWIALGAVAGAGLAPFTRRFLTKEGKHISAVLGALATAAVFGLLAWRVSHWSDLVGYSMFAIVGLAVSAVDVAEQRVPTRLVLPAYPMVVGFFGTIAILQRDTESATRAAIGLLALPVFYLILALVTNGGFGAGDIRFAGLAGWVMAWHGWTTLVAGTVLAFLMASVVTLTIILLRRATWRTPIPFGLAMVAGVLAAIVLRGA